MIQKRITDDLDLLLGVLPPHIANAVIDANDSDNLLEIVLDLGRKPESRFVSYEHELSDKEISHEDIDFIVERIGDFDDDNRAGMERTLHRISAIRNRRSHIVGLTCRVGRAVYGTIDIIQDLVESNKSILILGKPGIGKTTMLREAARILAEKKRVVIVDTSNEIGGDGDVPHPAIGRARRMQVASPSLQHEVMIEAVENHNPEVIVIDEIGRELEALAARTIAERGVQLIGTAHGRTLENLLLNPTLSDLIGGIESVTLSDEEARRRGTQKTVLERRSPPTFDVLIEIQERENLVIHPDVAEAVDALVRGIPLRPEIRYRKEDGKIKVEKPAITSTTSFSHQQGSRRNISNGREPYIYHRNGSKYDEFEHAIGDEKTQAVIDQSHKKQKTINIYPYGVARNRILQGAKQLGVKVLMVNKIEEADVFITLRAHYRNRETPIVEAEDRGMPIYVLRSNTLNQIEKALAEMFDIRVEPMASNNWDTIANQTQAAINAVYSGQRWIDMPPANAAIRKIQHEMARQANLVSHSYGKEPQRRVRIFRD